MINCATEDVSSHVLVPHASRCCTGLDDGRIKSASEVATLMHFEPHHILKQEKLALGKLRVSDMAETLRAHQELVNILC